MNGRQSMIRGAAPVAARHVAPSGGRTVRVLGNRVTYKAVAAETGGAYSLFEAVLEPGCTIPPHYGRYEDQTLWIIEGTFALQLGDETLELGPGGYAFVPRGTVHALANAGRGPARLLLLVTPGGLCEKYLAELGGARGVPHALAGPADVERAAAIAAKYGTEFLFARAAGPDPHGAQQQTGQAQNEEDQSEERHRYPGAD
jgi:quercetin dioxygenase-like cupin family protein